MNVLIAKTQKEIFEVMWIRTLVFMMEQQVSPDIEIDELDGDAIHFLLYDDSGKACACCRLVYVDQHHKIGRLAVLKEERHKGYASVLLQTAENYARTQGIERIYLNAQTSAQPLYEKAGYLAFGEVFDEANIEHIAMKKHLNN